MNTTLTARTSSPEETIALGVLLGQLLVGGDVVSLVGGLGAGKTTFVKGVAQALGGQGAVRSPTFAFVHHHACNPPLDELLHVDLYRLDQPQEVLGLALDELVDDGTVLVIEWMERAEGLLGEPSVVVDFSAPNEATRLIELSMAAPRLAGLVDALQDGDRHSQRGSQ